MSYYWNVIRCFFVNVELIMCPTHELIGVLTMILYHLIIVGKIFLAYPTNQSILPFLFCYTGEYLIFEFST